MTGLLGDADPVRLAERLLAALGHPYEFSGLPIFATASIGLVMSPADGDSYDSILRSAQIAANRARAAGGNAFRCHTPEMDAMARDWLVIEGALRTALRDGNLSLAYQPQFRLADMKETGSEALLRWSPPGMSGVGIDRAIAVAEASGLIVGEEGLGAMIARPRVRRCGSLARRLRVGCSQRLGPAISRTRFPQLRFASPECYGTSPGETGP